MPFLSFSRTLVLSLFFAVLPASGALVITSTHHLALVEEGGTLRSGNLAPSGTAFSQDEIGVAPHATAKVNDSTFGNSSSWIAGTANSFIGISLGSTPRSVNQIAFGRDNSGTFTDRCLAFYELQYTTVANPSAATSEASWISLGTLDYQAAGGTLFASPAHRHRFTFDAVNATGFRLRTSGTAELICMDELELYYVSPPLPAPTLVATGGGFLAGNLATTGTAFAKDVIGAAPHAIENVNDGTFGNPSSWIAGSGESFIGINLGATPVSVACLAFGRDNSGTYSDRVAGTYTFQFTTVPNPNGATPDASWTSFAEVTMPLAGDPTPALRHLFQFTPVVATGIRMRVLSTGSHVAIDELELYGLGAVTSDASLRALTTSLGTLSPAFTSATTSYTLPTLPPTATSITVTPTVSQPEATVQVNGVAVASGTATRIALNVGVNLITLLVTAPDGITTRTYQIEVTREMGLTLVAQGGTPTRANILLEADASVQSDPSGGVIVQWDDPLNISSIAWGRSYSGAQTDRWQGTYVIETLHDTSPTQSEWRIIGEVDYTRQPQTGDFSAPWLRHVWSFTPQVTRAIRIRTLAASGGMAGIIEQVEVYPEGPWLTVQVGNVGQYIQNRTGLLDFYGLNSTRHSFDLRLTNVGNAPLYGLNIAAIHELGVPNSGPYGSYVVENLSHGTLLPGTTATFTLVNFIRGPVIDRDYLFISGTAASNLSRAFVIKLESTMLCGTVTRYTHFVPPFVFMGVPVSGRFTSWSDLNGTINNYLLLGGELPPGVVMNSHGELSGTPTQTGVFYADVVVDPGFECWSHGHPPVGIHVYRGRLLSEGGNASPRNLAQGKVAFAQNELGIEPHPAAHVNDGVHGNASSWIAGSASSFVGINLGASPVKLDHAAWGRDNTNTLKDRWEGEYHLQYTTTPNPDASTPDSAWTSIENYTQVYIRREPSYVDGGLSNGHLRHRWQFPEVQATGFRIKVLSSNAIANYIAIDELELYGPDPTPAWRTQHFGFATANIGDLDDFDGDGIANLLEFAQGTLPNNAARRPLSYTGNVITPGQPVADGRNAVFIRRKDRIAAGLVYTVEFSPDLTTWTPVSATPTVLADDGTHEVVSVPMPPLDTRHFFRVKVNSVP